MLSITLPASHVVSCGYDAFVELANLRHRIGGTTLLQQSLSAALNLPGTAGRMISNH